MIEMLEAEKVTLKATRGRLLGGDVQGGECAGGDVGGGGDIGEVARKRKLGLGAGQQGNHTHTQIVNKPTTLTGALRFLPSPSPLRRPDYLTLPSCFALINKKRGEHVGGDGSDSLKRPTLRQDQHHESLCTVSMKEEDLNVNIWRIEKHG